MQLFKTREHTYGIDDIKRFYDHESEQYLTLDDDLVQVQGDRDAVFQSFSQTKCTGADLDALPHRIQVAGATIDVLRAQKVAALYLIHCNGGTVRMEMLPDAMHAQGVRSKRKRKQPIVSCASQQAVGKTGIINFDTGTGKTLISVMAAGHCICREFEHVKACTARPLHCYNGLHHVDVAYTVVPLAIFHTPHTTFNAFVQYIKAFARHYEFDLRQGHSKAFRIDNVTRPTCWILGEKSADFDVYHTGQNCGVAVVVYDEALNMGRKNDSNNEAGKAFPIFQWILQATPSALVESSQGKTSVIQRIFGNTSLPNAIYPGFNLASSAANAAWAEAQVRLNQRSTLEALIMPPTLRRELWEEAKGKMPSQLRVTRIKCRFSTLSSRLRVDTHHCEMAPRTLRQVLEGLFSSAGVQQHVDATFWDHTWQKLEEDQSMEFIASCITAIAEHLNHTPITVQPLRLTIPKRHIIAAVRRIADSFSDASRGAMRCPFCLDDRDNLFGCTVISCCSRVCCSECFNDHVATRGSCPICRR